MKSLLLLLSFTCVQLTCVRAKSIDDKIDFHFHKLIPGTEEAYSIANQLHQDLKSNASFKRDKYEENSKTTYVQDAQNLLKSVKPIEKSLGKLFELIRSKYESTYSSEEDAATFQLKSGIEESSIGLKKLKLGYETEEGFDEQKEHFVSAFEYAFKAFHILNRILQELEDKISASRD